MLSSHGSVAKWKRRSLQNFYARVRFPSEPHKLAKQSAGQNSYSYFKFMSAEHGGHGEETTITSIIVSILLALLLIPQIHEKLEEVTEAVVLGGSSGGHH